METEKANAFTPYYSLAHAEEKFLLFEQCLLPEPPSLSILMQHVV